MKQALVPYYSSYFSSLDVYRNTFFQIPSDFCPCFSEIEIPKSEAKEAAVELMRIVNDLLENTEKTEEYEPDSKELTEYMCTPMEIQNVEFSSVRLPMLSVLKDVKSEDTPLQSFSLQ